MKTNGSRKIAATAIRHGVVADAHEEPVPAPGARRVPDAGTDTATAIAVAIGRARGSFGGYRKPPPW